MMLLGLPRTRHGWAIWLAAKAIITGGLAMATGWVVNTYALPTLERESDGLEGTGLATLDWLVDHGPVSLWVGLPAVVLGCLAIAFKRSGIVLGVLGALWSLLALLVVLATLLAAMIPMYRGSGDLLQ